MKKWVIARRISQWFFLLLFIYIFWSTTYPLKGMLPADIFFKADPLLVLMTSISERVIVPGMIFSLLMIVFTFLLGRFFCGWVCPLGTMIDAGGSLRKKNRIKKDESNRNIRLPKYIIFILVTFTAFIGVQIAWVMDPVVIAARFVSLNLIPAVTLAVDKAFIYCIQKFELYGTVYNIYTDLKSTFLGIQVHFFSHASIIFAFFLIIISLSLILKRAWCRSLCPLGAFYAVLSRFSLLERTVENCTFCMSCKRECRMGAIKSGPDYIKSECILCMDCVYDCPQKGTRFGWKDPRHKTQDIRLKEEALRQAQGEQEKKDENDGMTRRSFLWILFASMISFFSFKKKVFALAEKSTGIIRPPGSLNEKDFVDRCVRCGNCMKVCITNGLQPVMMQTGLSGIWTPQLVPEIGYCEHQCTLCGSVCPTGAIPRLTEKEKMKTRLGIAKVDRLVCIPWALGLPCIVCEEHCPIPEKAIKLIKEEIDGEIIAKPYVDRDLCIGCAICQNVCPARPARAIKVDPGFADRK